MVANSVDTIRSWLKTLLLGVLRWNPNNFAFLGGVFISASVNLYTSVAVVDTPLRRIAAILWATVLLFVAGVCSSALSWNLDSINRLAYRESPTFMKEEQIRSIWEALVLERLVKLCVFLSLTVLPSISAFIILIPRLIAVVCM